MRVVAIKKNEYFFANNFHFARLGHEGFICPNVALVNVRNIRVNDDFHLIVKAVFERFLDFVVIHFSHLGGGLTNKTTLTVPISNEIFAFVLAPFVERTVVLHPIFTELHLIDLPKTDCLNQ